MNKTIRFCESTGFYTVNSPTPNPQHPALILIHGFCEDGSVWDIFRENLSRRFQVIVPDLPGYRNSSMTKQELTMEWLADYIKAIIDKEKIQQPVIIGHSMGGYIALALAEKFPDVPGKIGLFHSHCFADDDEKKKNRQKAMEFVMKNGTADFVNELYDKLFGEKFLKQNKEAVDKLKAAAKKYPAETIAANLKAMMNRPDRAHVLKSFRRPVLFILGKQDNAIPYTKSLEQCSFPEISEVHILDDAGHMGMLEAPKKTLEMVREFVNLNLIIRDTV
ncbi:MAG TPA: alpha/beta hydrolase [Chitinophagales bacterium]|nr:alpha/beta hydrolase [Chitinophagales bacterium]